MEGYRAVQTECVGIGCFWFAAKNVEEYNIENFSFKNFLESIKKELENIDNISNVEIFSPRMVLSYIPFSERLSGDYEFFPMFVGVEINFDLFMPRRLQEEYGLGWSDVGTEHLKVRIKYESKMPVVYIYYDVPENTDFYNQNPSSAIIFVREYLKKKLESSSVVNFQCLGPSPFHADFIIEKTAMSDENLEHTKVNIQDVSKKTAGYKRFIINIETENGSTISEFVEKYHRVFEAFYYLTGYRNALSRSEISAAEGANALFAPYEDVRLFPKLRGRLRQGSLVDKIYQTMLENKHDRIMSDRVILEQKREGTLDEAGPLLKFFEEFSDQGTTSSWDDVRELLKMIEERRQKYFSNLITLIAGLAGGVIGAIIGAALTFTLSKSVVSTTTTQATPAISSATSQPQKPATSAVPSNPAP